MSQETDEARALRLERAYHAALKADADYDILDPLRGELEETYRRILETNPDDADILTDLAVLLSTDVQLPDGESVELLWRVFDRDRGDEDACNNLVSVLEALSEEEEVDEVYRQASEAGNLQAAFELAARLDERGDLEEAEPLYRRAAEAGHADALANLADILEERGDSEAAMTLFRQALLDGGSESLNQVGRSIAKYDPERAVALFRRLVGAGDDTAPSNLAELMNPGRHWSNRS
ncbi:tetratricopeptide repeat protein [Streptomyces sp. ME19-01-6]|uniref:tetratricopeptide repeat protein n=1 Tax=Streptomyces sp. ME19-01-6 TaxID=3028686 RepID=UPI0029A1551B|nr:tetratricopeptide repeat protein [Streptomyces sp. ME19-01-6]MDX3226803.1 tetratricopeptide repeat protein [Streptomyces sp. ME19-01-6]